MQVLESPPLFSNKVSSAEPGTTTILHSKTCSIQVHRSQVYHSQREDLLDCKSVRRRQCPLEQGDLLEIDRGRNSEAQIRTLLDNSKGADSC